MISWSPIKLFKLGHFLWSKRFRRCRFFHHNHRFWQDYICWQRQKEQIISNFVKGLYQPQPMVGYNKKKEIEPYWLMGDAVLQRLLLLLIKPTFKHIISKKCLHLSGPSQIKTATFEIEKAIKSPPAGVPFRYFIRADIKSYYASISRRILKKQVQAEFKDWRVIKYLQAIIDAVIDRGGFIETPFKGIPRGTSLSGFFAALYLKSVDQAFAKRAGTFYVRYNDDFIILCQTKRQFVRGKKLLKDILYKLDLKLSPTKTKCGELKSGFHFLGINYAVTQIQQKINTQTIKNPLPTRPFKKPCKQRIVRTKLVVSLHKRTYHRARQKIKLMQEGASSLADVQSYISRWSRFWALMMVFPTTILTSSCSDSYAPIHNTCSFGAYLG